MGKNLNEDQLELLNRLLGEVLPTNEFYRRKLGEGGRTFASLAEFTAEVPFTTKEELAADHEAAAPYGTNHTYPLENYVRFHQTSGTRGAPLIWLDDPAGWEWILRGWAWVWEQAAIGKGDCAFFPFSFGPFLGFWGAYEAATKSGIRVVPGGGMSSEDRVRLLQRAGANVLCCTPTYALRLAEVATRMGVAPVELDVEKVLVCGEPGGSIPEVRARIEETWGARVIDHHGMTEIGPVTVSDLERPEHLLIFQEAYIAEVIDPETGAALMTGEVGELVLTTLGRAGSPLLRYRTGDLVKPIVVDGVITALDGGIIGRADDMVVVRGVNIYPSAVEAVVRSVEGVAEYQVVVDQSAALPEIHLSVEATAEVAGVLEKRFREVFSMRIPVKAVLPGSLPEFEVKAKRWRVV
jgi:phenylacetate-CoA ligase